ncbi:FadR/GntR family transcriptional regulator [Neorhizobium sp. Rsf11]|uniref:FadR/GntR family transcriptional regulator n=2 Tax=Neorhizobium TaxID=1525371 RepID=A0ABV0MB22_9HYPH|nr:FadR/GntR family transcriptional regulator [Neorhizobium petrolearium]MCC2613800.1 FadR family transcriptional regulator [Neorhizobium petrolearium]WGI72109.1 FadR/GntR family transcriptional regulator [Neorhizobium petrolearium]
MSTRNKQSLLDTLRAAIEATDERFIREERLLPERELSDRFGVGRRAVREALNELEGEGLLFRKQGLGTFVREVGPKSTSLKSLTNRTSPHDIIEVRLEIEPVLARFAATRATPKDIDQMKLFVRRAAQAATPREYERWDSAFHTKIAESVRNTMFWGVFRLINSVRKEQHWVNSRTRVFTRGVSEEMVRQHNAIVASIAARDPQAAEDAMRDHIATAGVRISQSIVESL